jgi:hypothetical protein
MLPMMLTGHKYVQVSEVGTGGKGRSK